MRKSLMVNIGIVLLLIVACSKDMVYQNLKTEHVIIVVIDGARYSETWGEPSHAYIPLQSSLSSQGVLFENFTNSGMTSTIPGHTSIVTGVIQTGLSMMTVGARPEIKPDPVNILDPLSLPSNAT